MGTQDKPLAIRGHQFPAKAENGNPGFPVPFAAQDDGNEKRKPDVGFAEADRDGSFAEDNPHRPQPVVRLRAGRGRHIIALAQELYASDHVPYLLNRIAEQAPLVRPVSFSFRQQASEPSLQHLEVGELMHPALLRYLQERGINTALARLECKELHFIHNGKPYFAIGFPNVAGGYEVSNHLFKGCISPKDISHIRQQGEPREKCLVFEGMMDYLSFLMLRIRNCPTMPNLDRQDYVILNSVSNVSKVIDMLHGYERIHCMLDNDEAGRKAYWKLVRVFSGRIRDFSTTTADTKI